MLSNNLPKFAEDFTENILEFLQPFWTNIWYVVNYHNWIYAIGFFGSFPQEISKQLWK